MTFPIDVISDVVCPWCFIGKRRLDAALAEIATQDPAFEPRVNWHPFQLNPDLPAAGIGRKFYLDAKFGGPERARETYARISAAGKTVGIAFDFERIRIQPNTLLAHRLVGWAQSEGHAASTLVERLFSAYFLEGRNIGDPAELMAITDEAGLDAEAAGAYLGSGEGAADIAALEAQARSLGVNGVPFFILAERVAVSGAQEVATLVAAMGEARDQQAAASDETTVDAA
jgi:predicted DsbA family dithiol-disulfide isomerase